MENMRILAPDIVDDKESQFYCWYLAGAIGGSVMFIKNNHDIPDSALVHLIHNIHSSATQVHMDYVRDHHRP